jgi:hypothetical protein
MPGSNLYNLNTPNDKYSVHITSIMTERERAIEIGT